MTTIQPPYSFIYWKVLLVRKWPPISLHIHSSTEGCCWSEKDHLSASIFIHLLKGCCCTENDHLSASIFIHLLIAVVAQKISTYQPPYSFFYWRLLLQRKWPPISLHIHSSTGGCCWSENDHLSASIFIHLLETVVQQKMITNQPPYSFFYWRLLFHRKWQPISLHIHSSTGDCCSTENDHHSASIFILLLEAVVGQKMTTNQPPYSFIYWRLLLVRKWPPISLHIHSSTGGCCCSENDHQSASIFILLLEAVVGQKMTTYQPPYSFIYWKVLLVRKWPPISLHIHSSTDSCCCTENDHQSASIFILLLIAVVGQKMTTYQPPYSFFYWRLLSLRKWPPISLHIHSSTESCCWSENDYQSASIFILLLIGCCCTENDHLSASIFIHLLIGCCCTENDHQSASIFIHLLKAVVAQKMTTNHPPYSFFYWRLLLLIKWPSFSLHIHSSTEGRCWLEKKHQSASIFILLLKAAVAHKVTTYQPPYSFFYW